MSPLDTENWSEKISQLWKFNNNIARSILILRLGGYCLLFLFLVEIAAILTPPRFMNPNWEFQLFGDLVERIAIPIIGLAFVFYGEDNLRSKWEKLILNLIYWLTLSFAISLLLLIPLSVVNGIRINRQNTQSSNIQVQEQIKQIQQIKSQLQQVTTPSQMDGILRSLATQGNVPKIQTSQQLEDIKIRASGVLTASENQIQATAKETLANQRFALIKNGIKWGLGALIAGVLFIFIWVNNNWVRHNKF